MVSGITFFFIKLSILLLYLRIFSLNLRTRCFLYCGILAILIFTIVSSTLYGTFCVPRHHHSWQEAAASRRCSSSQDGLEIANGAFNATSDTYILLLPLPCIWRLQLPTRKRLTLMATFLTGLLYVHCWGNSIPGADRVYSACTCSLASLGIRIKFLRAGDFTWNSTPILYSAYGDINCTQWIPSC